MQKRYIAPTIMLTAGAIVSICNIYYKIGLSESLKRLLITLVMFYIIGRIATFGISKITNPSKKEKTKKRNIKKDNEEDDKEDDDKVDDKEKTSDI